MLKRILVAGLSAVIAMLLVASPALAMADPDAIAFYCVGSTPRYKVFYNVQETGDWLIVAEQYVHYVVSQNYTAGEAFLFELLNTAGNETVASVPLKAYEAKPISIYLSAAQVSGDNLTVGGAYIIRLTGNPLIFSSMNSSNTVNSTLNAGDYVNQLLGEDGGVATSNNLRNFMINYVMKDIETYYAPPVDKYIVTVSGIRYLTLTGGSIALEGIPSLDVMCPILFQASLAPMVGDEPESTGAYASSLSPLAKWGSTSANGLTSLGVYLGINQALAGSLVLLAIVMAFAFWIYSKTQSGIATLLLVAVTPFMGVFLGLVPMALAFSITIMVVVFMGYFFFSRGTM